MLEEARMLCTRVVNLTLGVAMTGAMIAQGLACYWAGIDRRCRSAKISIRSVTWVRVVSTSRSAKAFAS